MSGRVALVVLGVALAGCASTQTAARLPQPPPLVDRVVVVARVAGPDSRPVAEHTADVFAARLRQARDAMSGRELLAAARGAGSEAWAGRLLERMAQGGWPTPEERETLQFVFRVYTLMTVDVTTYDQVWGRYAKFTRVALDVSILDVATGLVVWRGHQAAEVEDMRGRAFEYATEQVTAAMVDSLAPAGGSPIAELWRGWRR